MPGIYTTVADHLEMLFSNVSYKKLVEINGRNCFKDKLIIFMSVIIKSSIIIFAFVDTGCSNNRDAPDKAGAFLGDGLFGHNAVFVFNDNKHLFFLAGFGVDIGQHFLFLGALAQKFPAGDFGAEIGGDNA